MEYSEKSKIEASHRLYALQHLETGEYICLRHEGNEYLACFTDGDTAIQFREELGLLEHVDITTLRAGTAPFDHFWLDGEMIARTPVTERAAR